MFNWKRWLLFVLLGFVALGLLLYAITYAVKTYFGLSTADTLAFAQLVLSLLLLPSVLFGFFITVQAFRETQEHPDLDVFFETETGLPEKSLKFITNDIFLKSIVSHKPIPIVILNKGTAIALWYAINIKVQLNSAKDYIHWDRFWLARREHWQVDENEYFENKRLEAMFMSKGELAAYPNLPLQFCEMDTSWFIPSEIQDQTIDYQISYTIVTDRGHKKQGLLYLTFQPKTS